MPRTRTPVAVAVALTLAAVLGALSAGAAPARAQGDPRRDARLLYAEGKFAEAEDLLRKAGPEIADDLDLRLQLAEAAQVHLKKKTGPERRDGLVAAKRNYGIVAQARPGDGAAVAGAVLAARELAELDLAVKNTEGAKAQASWALELGEKAAAVGLSPEVKAALGQAYGLRAAVTRKVDEADRISSDYRKGAQMLEEAAAEGGRAAEHLAAAADLRFQEAAFLHDSIPMESERRDDEAIVAAARLARRACESKDAPSETFLLHIRTLCTARDWKVTEDLGAPFMEPLAPALQGLTLQVPKGVKWKRLEPTTEWQLILERAYDANDSSVQVMVTSYSTKNQVGAKTWSDVAEGAAVLFDRRKGGYDEVVNEEPVALHGDRKKGPQLFTFSMSGQVRGSSRRNRMQEFVWLSPTNKELVWNVRLIDWRRSPSLLDPDLVAFVQSAVPPGLWPPGAAKPAEDPKGKKPPKKR